MTTPSSWTFTRALVPWLMKPEMSAKREIKRLLVMAGALRGPYFFARAMDSRSFFAFAPEIRAYMKSSFSQVNVPICLPPFV